MGHAIGSSGVTSGGCAGSMNSNTVVRSSAARQQALPSRQHGHRHGGAAAFGSSAQTRLDKHEFGGASNAQQRVGMEIHAIANAQIKAGLWIHPQVHQVHQVQVGSSSAVGGSAGMSLFRGGGI
jgi:hypothetical protein